MKRTHKICIITHTHLSRNPRVVKEALTLSQAGYEVCILNATYSATNTAEDIQLLEGAPVQIIHISNLSIKNFTSLTDRLVKKAAHFLVKYLRIESRFAMGYAPLRYLKISKKLHADLYICHQELPLFIGGQLLKKGFNVAFDMEDWHSEDLPVKARASRPVKMLKAAEKFALKSGKYCSTTSHALAQQLAETYHCALPAVIYNSFKVDKTLLKTEIKPNGPLKLAWFSLNIGLGRGLEEFIAIINNFNINLELHLIGAIDEAYKQILLGMAKPHFNIVFYHLVPKKEICNLLSTFDIGLAIELHEPKNREYTITNKFFKYVQCGLPIIATNTLGQNEVFEKFNPGLMIDFKSTNHQALETWLQNFERSGHLLEDVRKMALHYDWENQAPQLLKLVNNAL